MTCLPDNKAALTKQDIPALTGIRWLFALCVVLLHTQIYTNWLDHVDNIRDGIVLSGAAGVNFFFILSGFILTYTTTTTPIDQNNTKRAFYLARFARIYPVYALGLLASIPIVLWLGFDEEIMPVGASHQISSIIVHASLLQGWIPHMAFHWNPPGWSLSAEAFFYALFPLLAPMLIRQNTRSIIIIAALSYGASLAIPLACHALGLVNMHVPGSGSAAISAKLYMFFPLIRLPEFILGIAAACLFLRERRTVSRYALVLLWIGFVGIVIGLQIGGIWIPQLMMNNGALGLFATFLILGLAATPPNSLSTLLGCRLMVRLGQASYALYVIHLPVLFLYVSLLPDSMNKMLALSLYLFGVTLLSVAIFRFYERPMQRMILRKMKKSGKH